VPADLDDVRKRARDWFRANWDPDLSVGTWWKLVAESGWGYPSWPAEWYGQGTSAIEAQAVTDERRRVGALGAVSGVATTLAAPTILAWGSDDQKRRYLPGIVEGRSMGCQLFSEPGSGSDLASLRTRAEPDGTGWVITGQKVWSSGAHVADFGILLARTDPDREKHAGISYFVIDMHQPQIIVRPIREMTGESAFCEVFFDGARVSDADRLGPVNEGWKVAQTTLGAERTSLGAGSMTSAGGMSGLKIGRPDLSARAGEVARAVVRRPAGGQFGGGSGDLLVRLAREHGLAGDPLVRQDIARVYSLLRIGVFTQRRVEATLAAGGTAGPEVSVGKLAATRLTRVVRDALLHVLGPAALLEDGTDPDRARAARVVLAAPMWSIGGGTDEIQRNIIGERVLGLPPEPRADRGVPFRQLRIGTQQ
jgi:alkylation response protein AidB-like acyl-CoA dehydrogenase